MKKSTFTFKIQPRTRPPKFGNMFAAKMQRRKKLLQVNLALCPALTDAAAELLARCEQLETVSLARCSNLTDAGLAR